MVLFISLPFFEVRANSRDISSGSLLRQGASDHAGAMHHGADKTGAPGHGAGHGGPMHHGGEGAGPMSHGGGHMGAMVPKLVVGTGYVALGLLGITLLVGPVNLLLGRRVPVSNYLSRDVGIWAAAFSLVHLIVTVLAHSDGDGLIAGFVHFFVTPDGRLLTNSFGLGNWTGLVALLIALGLLAISNDFSLRKLKAGPWKWLQRLNYALFVLVIAHAVFYGALLRITSPYTLLLCLRHPRGIRRTDPGDLAWRRRHSRKTATAQ
jgi:sulfoxide reductase heme-binding subunit YedZ